MQYAPTLSELQLLQQLTTTERFEYTTPRFVESEEVWSIGDEKGGHLVSAERLYEILEGMIETGSYFIEA